MEKVIHKYNLGEEPDDLDFWLTQSPQQRLAALQVLRERYIKFFLNGIRPGFQRVYTTSKLK
ncbi:MAG: hypothetical protein ACT4ON_01615 [Bacteroidota bacterium]